jgi:two-component system, OmpR family, response regulator
MRILLVEDDKVLADALSRALVQSAHAVDIVGTGESADNALALGIYDLAVLDIGLPGIDGLDVLRRLRARKSTMPVLILTALDSLEDRVRGLDLGADDYLAKPFDLPELEARVRALLRRGSNSTPFLEHGLLRFDTGGRRVYYDKQPLELSPRELAVLELLMKRAGRVVSKELMVNHLYGWGDEVGDNAIEVNVYRLRKKLEPFGCEIRTVRGMGYLMDRSDAAT